MILKSAQRRGSPASGAVNGGNGEKATLLSNGTLAELSEAREAVTSALVGAPLKRSSLVIGERPEVDDGPGNHMIMHKRILVVHVMSLIDQLDSVKRIAAHWFQLLLQFLYGCN